EVVHHLAGLDQQRDHALAVRVEGGQVGLEGDGGVVAGVLASVAAAGSRFGGGSGGGTGRSRSVRGGRLGAALATRQGEGDEGGQQHGAVVADGVHGGSGQGGAAILAQARVAAWKPAGPLAGRG